MEDDSIDGLGLFHVLDDTVNRVFYFLLTRWDATPISWAAIFDHLVDLHSKISIMVEVIVKSTLTIGADRIRSVSVIAPPNIGHKLG